MRERATAPHIPTTKVELIKALLSSAPENIRTNLDGLTVTELKHVFFS